MIRAGGHLQRAVLRARQQLEVMDADGRDDVSFPPRVAGAVRERHLIVALACPQQTQVLGDIYTRRQKKKKNIIATKASYGYFSIAGAARSAEAGGGKRVNLQFEWNIMKPMLG